MGKIFADIASK